MVSEPAAASGASVSSASSSSDPVSAGPSQCQWSPWGSQPSDSVGDGPGSTDDSSASASASSDASASSEASASSAESVSVASSEESVSAGPSQCQWSPWGSHPMDSVGDGPGSTEEVSSASSASSSAVSVEAASSVARGPSQCLDPSQYACHAVCRSSGVRAYQWSPWGSQPMDSVGEGAMLWASTAWSMPRATNVEESFISAV